MLRVFISSTFRDLAEERAKLLSKLNTALAGVGMEEFTPDGRTSQEIAREELKRSDIVIFLISPYYGSLIDTCKLKDCICLNNGTCIGQISYTHCEYKIALSEGKPHQAYLVDKDWEVIEKLKDWEKIDWREVKSNSIFKEIDTDKIDRYFNVAKKVWEFKGEAEIEFCPKISDFDDIQTITDQLTKNITTWYSEGKINITDFCGRRKELKDLCEKIDQGVEVYGVGGIGKTTLIHIALLIQRVRGKKIVTICTMQSYLTGSGYRLFKEKCGKGYTEILANKITLDDVVNALSISDEVKTKTKEEKIQTIANKIEKGKIVIFIDDFHLADEDVRTIVRQTRGSVALSTKNKISIARNEVFLSGIDESERDKLLDLIASRLDKHISNSARGKIKDIAEGHPASTEILVRNCDKINFDNVKGYKHGLDFSNTKHVEEFLKRVIREILSDNEFQLLVNLSVINSDLESNLNRETIQQTCQDSNFDATFAKLIDTCMLEKKPEYEGVYRFHYKHIQDAIKDNSKARHAWAIKYYENKVRKFGNNDDVVESLFHKLYLNQGSKLIDEFLTLSEKLQPVHYGFKRLIDIGEQIIKYSFTNRVKVPVVVTLGNLYSAFNRFDDAENAYLDALNICRKLAEDNPDAYLPDMATTQNNIGNLYIALNRFDDAEKVYLDALNVYRKLAEDNPDAYLPGLAMTQNNLKSLYLKLEKFDDAEKIFKEI
ncbi:MAG: tetratricopeptide repeat protein [Planctomycetota bacterium]|nr:tetratricopeptide repeat protein [Planctomycetota bacterium]